ncbi:hypothetical protein THIOSC13_170001 [uncultured Thiomicrorhabdus sp.]
MQALTITLFSTSVTLFGFKLVIDFPMHPKGLVRIKHLKGYWQLDQITENETLITHMVESNPSGQIPAWVTNQLISEIPVYSLEKLKNLSEVQNKTLF